MIFKYKNWTIQQTTNSYALFFNKLKLIETNNIDIMFRYIKQYERNEKLNDISKFLFSS